MKILVILLLIAFTSFSALQTEQLKSQEAQGQYSALIEAKQEHANIPAQYYLCGFSFQPLKWQKMMNNCNCHRRWYQFRARVVCTYCFNDFWNRAAGFTAIFCHYKDWNDQIVKKFSTGSATVGEQRARVMCPINNYASGFQGKFGAHHGQRLWFNGMLLRCTSPDYKSSQNVQDTQAYPTTFYAPKYGLFLSSFKVKFLPGGQLTGIQMFAEGMPLISNIKIDYDMSAGFENYPVTIDSQVVENCGKQTAQKNIAFTKSYETTGQWSNNNPEVKGYILSTNIVMAPPSFMTADAAGVNTIYKSTTGQFGFENPVKTVISSTQGIIVFITAKHSGRISSTLQEQKGSIPYNATLTLVNNLTGQKITEYKTTGNWQGVTTSAVETKIFEIQAKCERETPNDNNGNQRNLRI